MVIKIGETTYNYNKNKPITERLKKKLNKVKSTIDYKRHELVEKKDIKWLNVDKNKALKAYQKRFKATMKVEMHSRIMRTDIQLVILKLEV